MGDEAAPGDSNNSNTNSHQSQGGSMQQESHYQLGSLMQPAVPSTSTTFAVAGCAAVVFLTTLFAVVLSALRGGVVGAAVAMTLSASAVAASLLICVWAATRVCPALLAAIVQIVAVEVIRFSGAMAEDDDEAEEESWSGMKGDGRAVKLGKDWAEGRLSLSWHERRFRKQPEHEAARLVEARGGSRQRRWKPTRRRVTVDWEDGQMFLVVYRPVASRWLVDLVNRYMHGPIPMKAESCRAELLRVNMSPAHLVRLGSLEASVVGLRIFGRRTHEDEWDEGLYYEKAIRFRRWAADFVQALIEGTYGRKMKAWGGIVDSLINNVTMEAKDVHLRIDDRWEGHCFGLLVDGFTCAPGVKEPESLGATPHEFSVSGILFYVDAHNEIARSPECPAMTMEKGTFRVEFPDIFRTLILNREIMPGGRGKRLRVRGDFTGCLVNLQANQMRTFLFSLLGTFCPYKYSAWKAAIREQAALDCRPVSAAQRWQYLETFGTAREEARLSRARSTERLLKLAELERHMSYRDILLLRKEVRGWRLENMGEPPPVNQPPLDPEFMQGVQEGDPQYEELARFAARIQGLQLSAWEISTCLREIMVETVVFHRVEARLCKKADPERDGPENRAFQTPLQAVMFASRMEGRFRMFIARTKASNRLHSRAANGVDGEPALPWLMSGGTMQHPVVLDEATASRLGYGSTCILSPAGAAATAVVNSDGEGERSKRRGDVAEDMIDDGAISEMGGTFRMWSDYRMSVEGSARNVHAGTLLPPVLDLARTIADSFRRRWADGGQYPERKLARVRLAEKKGRGEGALPPRSGSDDGSNKGQDAAGSDGGDDESVLVTAVAARKQAVAAMRGWREVADTTSSKSQAASVRHGGGADREGGVDGEGEKDELETVPLDRRRSRGRQAPRGFRQALSRLDDLDTDVLVEEALEDLQDKEHIFPTHSTASGDGTGPAWRERRSNAGNSLSERGRDAENATAMAGRDDVAAQGLSPAATAGMRSHSTSETAAASAAREGLSVVGAVPANASEDTDSVKDAMDADAAALVVEAAAGEVASQRPIAEKFMLPGWHYLCLSGRSLSLDIRWTNVDLLLMQDPTAQSGRDSGKNVLAMRSSGALTMRSSGPGESVDAQLEGASLLPCFYGGERIEGDTASSGPEFYSRWRDRHNKGDEYEPPPEGPSPGVHHSQDGSERTREETSHDVFAAACCLAQLLGGGDRVHTGVARTWLGQGLVAADSRPLLEPFSVQFGYGTVIAQTVHEGHGTGVDAGETLVTSDAGRQSAEGRALVAEAEEGLLLSEDRDVEDDEDNGIAGGTMGSAGRGEMVAGVFRVAVSELSLLAAQSQLKGPATIEVEVNGQTRAFLAAAVTPPPTTSVGDKSVELEFVCRCRLRRRRGRRRQSLTASGAIVDDPATAATATTMPRESVVAGRRIGIDAVSVGAGAEGTSQEDEEDEDGSDEEGEAQPEAAAKVQVRSAGGQVLGEAWAELPGAPRDWARYPLYAPGAARGVSYGIGGGKAVGNQGTATELHRALPGTLRRQWGWGGGRDRSGTLEVKKRAPMSALVVGRSRWFRPRRPRDVAGEVKLRLEWVPSGLTVTVHRWREIRPTPVEESGAVLEAVRPGRRLLGGGRRRHRIVVSAEPGGGSVEAHPIVVDAESLISEEIGKTFTASGSGKRIGKVGEAHTPTSERTRDSSPYLDAGEFYVKEESESIFFSLNPTCLLSEVDATATGANIEGGEDIVEGGGGARLVLLTADDGAKENSAGIGSGRDYGNGSGKIAERTPAGDFEDGTSSHAPAARAELLLFPGAEPARRWVSLADPTGQPTDEVDISVGWALRAPVPAISNGDDQCAVVSGEGRASDDTLTGARDGGAAGVKVSVVGKPLDTAASEVRSTRSAATDGLKDDGTAETAATRPGTAARKGTQDDGGNDADSDLFPEPAQVVARCFTVHVSDLVLRVSDLDVAVLVTMAKSIVRVFKPPQSTEEKELALEAVQQRLLKEASSKRNAAIQQLRAAFQRTPTEEAKRGSATTAAAEDESEEELLNVRDVVELLRDFLRAKALTESEISREAEEFMLVVLAVEDAAKRRALARLRARSASPGRRRSPSGSAVPTSAIDDLGASSTGDRSGGRGWNHRSSRDPGPSRWLTRLRPGWNGNKEQRSASQSIEGFICPQCRKKLASPAALLAHFHVLHGGGGNNTGSIGGAVGDGDGSGRGSDVSGDEAERTGGRNDSRRGGWQGSSICLDHFISALQSFMEEQPHEGYVVARCEEFASKEIERVILAGYPSLPHRLAGIPPTDPLPEFWGVMKHEVGVTRLSGGGQQVRVVQTRMVRALKNYAVARSAWAHLVVPSLWGVPRCGSIKTTSGRVYLPMPCPVREGQSFYVDKPAMVITRLPSELSGLGDKGGGKPAAGEATESSQNGSGDGGGGGGGGGGRVMLTGIMTHSKDRGLCGVRAFLTFTLDRPAVVYVCYDQRLKRLPVWLMYFERTRWIVRTTEGLFGVWRKRYAKGQVRLGCNEGWRKGCANYFLLIGADDPTSRRQSGGSVGGGGESGSGQQALFPLRPAPAPALSPSPAGLFPDTDGSDGGSSLGGNAVVSPRWVLRPHMVAGGKGSLAQAVRALVDERRKSRAMSRSQLVPGGESRTQLDEAAATAAELGLELAPVEFHYTAAFDLGNLSFRMVDPTAVETVHGVKAEVRITHASGDMMLRHLHPGDWLGAPDSLTLRASAGGGGTYYNPLVDAREHFIEPWSGVVDCQSDRGKATTELRVVMPEHLVVNLTSALVENVKSIAALVARNWTGRYTEPLVGLTQGRGGGGSLVIRNKLGIAVIVKGVDDPDDSEGSDEGWGPTSRIRGGDIEVTGGDNGAATTESAAERRESLPVPRDVSYPTTVPAGQAIECRLPSSRREAGTENFAATAEIVVYVPGFETVRRVCVGSRGCQAYPLTQLGAGTGLGVATVDGGKGGSGRGVAERFLGVKAAAIKNGLALVVEVRDEGVGADGGSSGNGKLGTTAVAVAGGLVAELRTNVCLQNSSASDVEVDIGETAATAVASSGLTKGGTSGSWRVREGWTPGSGAASVVKVAPGARLALPLSVLASWQLRLVGDATDTRVRPLRLSPALLDPAVPDALRLTGDMERNSLCLKVAKPGVGLTASAAASRSLAAATAAAAAAACGEPYALGSGASSPTPKSRRSVDNRSPTPRIPSPESSDNTEKKARTGNVSASRVSPPSSPRSGPASSGGVDWVLIVQPSYLITNALPCALEVEILQPVTGGAGGVRRGSTEQYVRGRSRGGSDASDATNNANNPDEQHPQDDWNDNASNSDAGSVASWSTATTRQSVSSRATTTGASALTSKAAARNPALDLFFLPTAVGSEDREHVVGDRGGVSRGSGSGSGGKGGTGDTAATGKGDRGTSAGSEHHVAWLDSERPESDGKGGLESVWKGIVSSGQEAKVGRVDNSRPFFFRLRLTDPTAGSCQPASDRASPPCCHWSDLMVITTSEHAHRSTFNTRQPEDITWRSAARADWGRPAAAAAAAAAVDFGSGIQEYEEAGRARRQQCPELKAARSWGRSSARRLTFYAPYWIVNKTGLALNYRARFTHKAFKILSDSSDRQTGASASVTAGGGGEHADAMHRQNGIDHDCAGGASVPSGKDGAFHEHHHGEQRGHVSSAQETAIAQVSRLLLQEAKYISDEEHLAFFGGRSLPVMLSCPARTLEVMPYALAGRAEDAGLCVCDLQVASDSSSLYYCSTDPGPASRLYTDCAVRVVALPSAIAEAATKPRSAVQILTPWREPPAPEKEAFMTFWLTRDAIVHVCMDSRTPPSRLPSWLEYAGFRKASSAEVKTSEPGLTLQVYRRFFRARTLVKLGGSDNGRDLATALTDFSGAAVTPDGPAPKSMLANYTVLLTTVATPRWPPQLSAPNHPSPATPEIPRLDWSSSSRSESSAAVAAAAVLAGGVAKVPTAASSPAARFEEADVRDALVDRDVGESIVCRRRYRILPDFSPGDRPYVDRDYTIPTLPAELKGLRLTCIQTAQGDKRAGGSRLWRLSLMQDSVVLVVFDSRAISVPHWLATSGFTLWEGVEVAGAEYRIPYVYKVYRKRCPTGLVWLGGNGARGCKGAKRSYFILIYVADRPSEAAPSPAPRLPSLRITAHSRGDSVGGGAGTAAWTHEGPDQKINRDASDRSLLSRSPASGGFSVDTAGGGGGDEDDDSVVSAPSTPGSRPGFGGKTGSTPRSFQSLDDSVIDYDAAASSCSRDELDRMASRSGFGAGGGVSNRKGRSMSTTISRDSAREPAVGGGGGGGSNRARAWTGGELSGVSGSAGLTSNKIIWGGFDRSGGHCGGPQRAPDRGLQRISAIWDTEKNGPLSQMPVQFDRAGRRWSRKFNVDAANTAGPLETSGATLGVSVSALTGQFHRTRVVTLYPRLIVRNFLGIPLEVMPTVMSPKAAAVTKLSRCLPSPAPRPRHREQEQALLRGHRHVGPSESAEKAGGTRSDGGVETSHLAQAVPTSSAVIVYAFNPVDRLVKGLTAAARAAGRSTPAASDGHGGGDVDDHRKCVLVRAAAPEDVDGSSCGGGLGSGARPSFSGGNGGAAVDGGGGGGGFGSALASGLSRPVLAEEMGETHLWVVDWHGRRHLAAAFVSLQRATVFITLSASAQHPPFQVENRSSMETLAYRQEDADGTMGWHILPPLTWHAFLWQEPHKPRAIEVAFAGALSAYSGGARHSEVYSLDKIGQREPLAEQEASITRSVLTLVATGAQVKTLSSEVRVEGRTRVLSFGDVRLSNSHAQGANADSVTRLKRLYNQLDVSIRFAGLSFNVVECKVVGPTEVMSAHVDSVTVAKRSGGNRVEVQVFHVQVDDMRRRTRMPVVIQPSDSGFNSHRRGSAAIVSSGGGGGSAGAGDEIVGGPRLATPVPFLRVLYEREVATLSMPHLKSLDIELQETRMHVDLEFVLHLLGLAGALLPELASEEVLAKMCRQKAKVAVRHTVPTPAKRDMSMVYIEAFRHSTIVVRLELLVGQGALSPDAAALEDPEDTTGGLTVLGGGFLTVLSVLGSSIAHVNPTFVFDELVVTHYCGGLRGLVALVLTALTQQAVAQGYKVVGSMELLGDPLSLVSKLGDSVVQFFHKTRAEMTGSADTMGAGAKVLVKGLVGGTFGSAAKITGSLEGMIRGLSGTAIIEDELYLGGMRDGDDGQGEVKDLEHGMKQGGKVFYESMRAGISGLVDRPMEGAKDEGFAGFIAGMAKGIVGAVAAPVAGALGAVARAAEGVDASTRLSDEKRMGRRRASRTLVSSYSTGRALTPLTPSDLVKHIPRKFATLWAVTATGHDAGGGNGGVRAVGGVGGGGCNIRDGGDGEAVREEQEAKR